MSKRDKGLITQAEYARHRKAHGLVGTTGAAVTYALQSGRITFAPGTSLIDPALADRQWAQNSDARPVRSRGGATASQAEGDYARHRAARERYEAELAELKVLEKQGRLIHAEVVRKLLYEAGRIVRAGHEDIVSQLAPDLASATGISAVERVLKARFDRLDSDLAERAGKLNETILALASEDTQA